VRAPIDPDAKEGVRKQTELEKLNADIQRAQQDSMLEGGSEEDLDFEMDEEPVEDEPIEDEPVEEEQANEEQEMEPEE
jgi:hypothetical protein